MNLDKKTKIKFNVLAIICIIIFCAVLTPITFQNDTFYTIKIGEDILNNGIDMQDHYSWHEDLPYTYPHWAYDVGTFLVYNLGQNTGIENGGFLFLVIATAILACSLGVLLYVTSSKISKNNLVAFILTLIVMYLLRDYIAARAQLLTFNLFVLTILFIESFLESKKKRYLIGLVVISIVIANVHVAVWPFFFVLFMPYIAGYIIAWIKSKNLIANSILLFRKNKIKILEKKIKKIKDAEQKEKAIDNINEERKLYIEQEQIIQQLKNKKEKSHKIIIKKNDAVKWLVLIMVVCALTGLLTPLKDTPYTYLVKTMQGNTTKSISEHQPLTLFNDTEMMITLGLIFLLLIFTDVKLKLEDIFMVGGLLFLLFMSRRQISMFLIVGIVILAKWLASLGEKYDKGGSEKVISYMTGFLGKTFTICLIILISLLFIRDKKNNVYIDNTKYPVEASKWISENLDLDNIKLYNEYNYGSYLLYKGIPVFIDSRADLYAPEFNKKEGEEKGRDLFSDYINIASINVYYENKFDEYKITHAIVYNNAKLNMFLSRNSDYEQLYKDDYFTIYKRNK